MCFGDGLVDGETGEMSVELAVCLALLFTGGAATHAFELWVAVEWLFDYHVCELATVAVEKPHLRSCVAVELIGATVV